MSIFDEIRNLKSTGTEPFQWYRNRIRELGTPTQSELLRDGRLAGRFHVGRLNMFVYDPKYKNKLPYYDVFPLVLPIERYDNGFLGINFHYLPYALRARLLDAAGQDELNVDAVMSSRLTKPTIKRYLFGYTRSMFRKIDTEDNLTAIMLPVQRFKKADEQKIWADSRKLAR